jgi:hypothetical protein
LSIGKLKIFYFLFIFELELLFKPWYIVFERGDNMPENTSVRLKQLMAERHLKQIDIVNLCKPYCQQYNVKLSKSDLSQFVSGKVEPGQWKLTILGLALDVSEAWLMGLDVPRERKEHPATVTGSGMNPDYDDLTAENRALVDDLIAKLLKSQSAD